jgi:hypothetical protein
MVTPSTPNGNVVPLTGGGLTDPSGVALFSVRGTVGAPATFNVSVDGQQLQPITVTFSTP